MKSNSNRRRKKRPSKKTRNSFKRVAANYTDYSMGPFDYMQPRLFNHFRYADSINVGTIAGGGWSYWAFRLNSIFDPDSSGSGHQPYGHDAMAGIYNRYRVYTCEWKVTIPSQSQSIGCFCVPLNGAAFAINSASTFALGCEMPRAKSGYTSTGGAPPVIFKGKLDLWKLTGVTRGEYTSDDRYASSYSGNPSEQMELELGFFNNSTANQDPRFIIDIWYTTESYDPIVQSASYLSSRLKTMELTDQVLAKNNNVRKDELTGNGVTLVQPAVLKPDGMPCTCHECLRQGKI